MIKHLLLYTASLSILRPTYGFSYIKRHLTSIVSAASILQEMTRRQQEEETTLFYALKVTSVLLVGRMHPTQNSKFTSLPDSLTRVTIRKV